MCLIIFPSPQPSTVLKCPLPDSQWERWVQWMVWVWKGKSTQLGKGKGQQLMRNADWGDNLANCDTAHLSVALRTRDRLQSQCQLAVCWGCKNGLLWGGSIVLMTLVCREENRGKPHKPGACLTLGKEIFKLHSGSSPVALVAIDAVWGVPSIYKDLDVLIIFFFNFPFPPPANLVSSLLFHHPSFSYDRISSYCFWEQSLSLNPNANLAGTWSDTSLIWNSFANLFWWTPLLHFFFKSL